MNMETVLTLWLTGGEALPVCFLKGSPKSMRFKLHFAPLNPP